MSLLGSVFKALHGPVYRSRIAGLCHAILPHLQPGDRVLDIGCGFGALGRAIMDHPDCPPGVAVRGLERVRRGSEAIPVDEYDGQVIPFDANAFDVVIVADVLHHEPEPDRLIAESARVAGRRLIIKDHKSDGLLAWPRICLMDWAANTAYGVPCLFRYLTLEQWQALPDRLNLHRVDHHDRMQLYPFPYRLMFTPRLQYFLVLDTASFTTPHVQSSHTT